MDSRPQKKSFWDQFATRRKTQGKTYSHFVRFMRVVLPLVAAGMIGLLVAWPRVETTMEAIPKEAVLPQEQDVGGNELLSPRFESRDKKDQPFTITASRAVQSARDPQVVLLEKPMADITLKNGTWLAAEAGKGAYRQDDEKLLLESNVKLFHDDGYELLTEKLLVNIKTQEAWSDQPVRLHGPAGTLDATGMVANGPEDKLIFTGPAKLVMNRAVKGL